MQVLLWLKLLVLRILISHSLALLAVVATDRRAIRLSGNTGPISFLKCLFKDFNIGAEGGAISSQNSTLNISSCSFVNNSADNGGALALSATTSTIENTTFWDNNGVTQAGAIQVGNVQHG
ncbi:MAG: hypothetical protein IPG07_11325 [Crocinitomicaceae bacterium]|nr:hypothetical protein [Crocinitomicaceae bacterium]